MKSVVRSNTSGQTFTDTDDLLLSIDKYVRKNEEGLKLGKAIFYLNPSCLEYLNLYIRGKRVSFKVDKSSLLDLSFILSLVLHIKIDSNTERVLEKTRELDLTIFESLQILELNYVKPALITNLYSISKTLTTVAIHQSLYSLDELLIVEDEVKLPFYGEISQKVFDSSDPVENQNKRFQDIYSRNNIWSSLTLLDCSYNFVPKIDISMYSLLNIIQLNLEGNLIGVIENLHECISLRKLNLSFNRISNINTIYEVLGMVTHLSLRGNQLTSVDGLHKLYALQDLDVAKNRIEKVDEIFKLKHLPHLSVLYVEGNPLTELKLYRGMILCSFFEDDVWSMESGTRPFKLDGQPISHSDIDFVKKYTGAKHASMSSLAIGDTKKKSNRIKPMNSNDNSTPALIVAPNACITSDSPVLTSTTPTDKQPHVKKTTTTTTSKNITNNNNNNQDEGFQRVVDLEAPITSSSFEDSLDSSGFKKRLDEKYGEGDDLMKKIDDLRKEGGNAWLRILNEMTENQPNYHQEEPTITTPPAATTTPNKNGSSTPTKKVIRKVIRKGVIKPKPATTTSNDQPTESNQNSQQPTQPQPQNEWSNFNNTTKSPSQIRPKSVMVPKSVLLDNNINTASSTTTTNNTTSSTTQPNDRPRSQSITANTSQSTSPIIFTNEQKQQQTILNNLKKEEHLTKDNMEKSDVLRQSLLLQSSKSKLLCEPFFVVKYSNSQDIVLEIKSDLISETHPITGNSIVTHLLTSVVFVRKFTGNNNDQLLEITYGKDFKDSVPTDFEKQVYVMEDSTSADLATTVLKPLLKEYTMSCMDCTERYVCRNENQFFQCIRCRSKFLFFVPTTTPTPAVVSTVNSVSNTTPTTSNNKTPMDTSAPTSANTSFPNTPPTAMGVPTTSASTNISNNNNTFSTSSAVNNMVSNLSSSFTNTVFGSLSTTPTNQALSMDETDDDFNHRIFNDQNLQLHFRLHLFKGASRENFVYILQSNYVRYNTQEDEKSVYLLLTSLRVYLLRRDKKTSGSDQGFTLMESFAFSDIRRVSVGLFFQLFRFELEDECIVFLKRSHESSHRFLTLLFENAKREGVNLEPYYKATDTLNNISTCLNESRENFELYVMLFQRISNSKNLPKSLIITKNNIYLCQENFIQWPLLNSYLKTSSPHFTITKALKLTDITNLQNIQSKPNELIINFESEYEPKQQWSLITTNPIEQRKIQSTISRLWKKHFQLDLPINK